MEALCDIEETELAKEAMDKLSVMLDEKGYIPAFKDVDWVCSTGMFQLAITWYKLGDIERGNKALTYAAKLQNETGGWFGSYAADSGGGKFRSHHCRHSICIRQRPCESARCRVR